MPEVPAGLTKAGSGVIPTGLPSIDALLGGGLPIGVTLVSGNHAQIDEAREAMVSVPDEGPSRERRFFSIPTLPSNLEDVPKAMQDFALLYGRGSYPTIVDTGDLTGKFPGSRASEERLFEELRQVALRVNAAIFVELVPSGRERQQVMRVVDTAINVTREGTWTVQKARMPVEVPFQFSSQAWGRRAPATPERVVAALCKNPVLAWEVVRSLRLLGPWETYPDGAFTRRPPGGGHGAVLSRKRNQDQPHLSFTVRGQEADAILPAGSEDSMKAAADQVLRNRGFTLLDEVPPW